jgi:hypothetical protein
VSAVAPQVLRVALRVVAVIAAVAFLMSVRVVSSSRDELRTADALRARGDFDGAVVHYRRSAAYYVPGNPFGEAAFAALTRIARDSESAGHLDVALSAWRSVRAAIMQARSFYTPHHARLAAADTHIADLTVRVNLVPTSRTNHAALRTEVVRARLARNDDPRFLGSLLVLVGFAAWVCGAFLFSVYAIDEEDRFVPGHTRRLATAMLIGISLFLLGLLIA